MEVKNEHNSRETRRRRSPSEVVEEVRRLRENTKVSLDIVLKDLDDLSLKILSALTEPYNVKELSEMFKVSHSMVLRRLQKMEAVGLVESRVGLDRRKRYFEITDLGRKVLERREKG